MGQACKKADLERSKLRQEKMIGKRHEEMLLQKEQAKKRRDSDCSGLSKEARWNSRNQGSSQLTIWQWLTCTHRV